MPISFLTQEFKLGFCKWLLTPEVSENNKFESQGKYSFTFIVSKSDCNLPAVSTGIPCFDMRWPIKNGGIAATMQNSDGMPLEITSWDQAFRDCAQSRWPLNQINSLHYPVKDEDLADKKIDVFSNHFSVKISSKFPFNFFFENGEEADPQKLLLKSGDFLRAVIRASEYDADRNKGISAYASALIFVRKGDPLFKARTEDFSYAFLVDEETNKKVELLKQELSYSTSEIGNSLSSTETSDLQF